MKNLFIRMNFEFVIVFVSNYEKKKKKKRISEEHSPSMPTTVKMHAHAAANMVALFGYTITVVILSTYSMSYENGKQTKRTINI